MLGIVKIMLKWENFLLCGQSPEFLCDQILFSFKECNIEQERRPLQHAAVSGKH